MSRPELTFTAEELTQLYSSCNDSVVLINGVIADTWEYNDYPNLDQADKNALVARFVDGLETRMDIDAIAADATSKTPFTNAIAAGKAYIVDNS
jgi:hypothetical protein|tara:strand:- start:1 stop:282 length:282 start_codon:yes stop_codon:yes gene_type:complete